MSDFVKGTNDVRVFCKAGRNYFSYSIFVFLTGDIGGSQSVVPGDLEVWTRATHVTRSLLELP